jgi:hypothetical protein
MANHHATLARIVEMARIRFIDNEPAVQAFARFTYDAEEIAAYAPNQDADDEEHVVPDAACGAMQLPANLCAELREEASASVAAYRSARAVARAHAEVLHANGPLGWAPIAEVLDKVDNEDSDDLNDFDDEEDDPGVTSKQRTFLASFETARRDGRGAPSSPRGAAAHMKNQS